MTYLRDHGGLLVVQHDHGSSRVALACRRKCKCACVSVCVSECVDVCYVSVGMRSNKVSKIVSHWRTAASAASGFQLPVSTTSFTCVRVTT